jgi:putative transposase
MPTSGTTSVFATLKCELFDQQPGGPFPSHHQAKLATFDYLEAFYNPRRRHSALGQMAPATFETNYRNASSAA